MRGFGRAVFVAIMLAIAGSLNFIYGIAAIGDSNFFANRSHYVFAGVHEWGWITLLLGVLELVAAGSLVLGSAFGRIFGILAASLGAVGALLAVGGAYPFWSLGVFAICVICIHGLVVYGEDDGVIRP
ncbi:MAG: hypothetical protein JST59_26655 [Actinobacteria bacterium]|nr:hypothetical protein [Actinomycetota bacterium]